MAYVRCNQNLSELLLLALVVCMVVAVKSVVASPFFRLQHRYHGARSDDTLEHLKLLLSHDKIRHRRILASAVYFPLGGTANPNVAGLYFTELQLGTPPSSYYVQVDTGSDLLWVNCASCTTCPTSSNLGVPLMLFDPTKSNSSSQVTCGDSLCEISSSNPCSSGQTCGYQLTYGDGSNTTGYFVKDKIQLSLAGGNTSLDSTIVFGCGTDQSGDLQQQDQALDGILGFGQSNVSIIKQLMSQGITPGVFAHCLEGQGVGGGILVIGQVQTPGIVYTPIIPNQSHYNVNLTTISFKNTTLSIDISTSSSGSNSATIIDSGTTLAYFVEPAYDQLIQGILEYAPVDLAEVQVEGLTCVVYSGSLDDIFPTITFIFDGASMNIKPHDYFIQMQTTPDVIWCVGFQPSSLGVTILGDLVLKDKLFVYDLEQQQIGWVEYNCSSSIEVNSTGQIERASSSTIVQKNSGIRASNKFKGETLSIIICFICILTSLLNGYY